VADHSRIDDLKRRVQKDPASIAFAQLAEEHRRAGQYEEAVQVATAGLAHHPAYLSARVTLGRALLELGRLDEAAAEFEYVVRSAPDNLTAVRQLADIHQRRRQSSNESKSRQPDAPVPVSRLDTPPVIETTSGATQLVTGTPAMAAPSLSITPAAPRPPEPVSNVVEPPPAPPLPAAPSREELVIAELEAWLAVIDEEQPTRDASHAHSR
jgi:tetratricopeptide (TPR) repeat protein